MKPVVIPSGAPHWYAELLRGTESLGVFRLRSWPSELEGGWTMFVFDSMFDPLPTLLIWQGRRYGLMDYSQPGMAELHKEPDTVSILGRLDEAT